MRKYTFATVLLAAVTLSLSAQNLDPTVEVRRAYEGKLTVTHKPQFEMMVPDSVQHFRLDFDYSVFDSPYKGSYEFNPYKTVMNPVADLPPQGRFYLRVGAGYPLAPVGDLVWSPAFKKGGFRMDVFASHRSYFGSYRKIGLTSPKSRAESSATEVRTQVFDRLVGSDGSRLSRSGYDSWTEAGVDGRYDWEKGCYEFALKYDGTAMKDNFGTRSYNAVNFNTSIGSKSRESTHFVYNAAIRYDYSRDWDCPLSSEKIKFDEHLFGVNARVGQVFVGSHSILLDADISLAIGRGRFETLCGRVAVTPHYAFAKGRWNLDLGLSLGAILHDKDNPVGYEHTGQIVYPQVKVEYEAINNAMKVYLSATGGETVNTVGSLTRDFRYLRLDSSRDGCVLDNTIERLNSALGIKGRISTRFSYDLKVGVALYGNAPLQGVKPLADGTYCTVIEYLPYNQFYTALNWNWNAESIRFYGSMKYSMSWGLDATDGVFAPSPFTGRTGFTYNWRKRIYAGVDCEWASGRLGGLEANEGFQAVKLRGYADLGVKFEYVFSGRISLWARGCNLLNMTIQRTPLYAEGSVGVIAGIVLSF